MSPLALVCSSPYRSPTRYVRGALLHPTSATLLGTAVAVTAYYASALAVMITIALAVAIAVAVTQSAYVRSELDAFAAARHRRMRDGARLRRVAIAGPARTHQYRELTELTDEIERIDPTAAARFDLEGLLEQFVVLARSHHRCMESLRHAPPGDAPSIERSRMRETILERRVRMREDCRKQISKLAEELAAIDELLRLIAHRVAISPAITDTGELERRLSELDEVDAAMIQLCEDSASPRLDQTEAA